MKKQKNKITVTKLKNLTYEKAQKLKLGQNSKTQIVTKLKNSSLDKTQKVSKLKNSNFDKNENVNL